MTAVPRRPLALLLALTLLAGACGTGTTSPGASSPGPGAPTDAIAAHEVPLGATAPVDDATWALAERIAAPAYTGDATDAFDAALARSGIAVVPDTSTDPATALPEVPLSGSPSPVELLEFQAHALAVQAWGGATFSGAELDGIVALPPDTGSPTLADLLDGYVGAVDTPGGALARALMAGQDLHDPAAVRFPAVVLFLFISDVATNGGQLAAPSASPSAAAQLLPLAPAGPVAAQPAIDLSLICAGPSGWIDAVVSRIIQALTAAVPQNIAGAIVVTIFGWVIHTIAAVVKSVINTLLGPILGFIRGIAVLASTIAEKIATLLPYVVRVTVNGGEGSGGQYAEFTLGDEPQFGAYDVSVTAGGLPAWPEPIATCAQAAGITLPDFTTKNAPTTFGPVIVSYDQTQLLFRGSAAADTTVTDATGQAHWPFSVGSDPGHGQGATTYQADTMPVSVHRKELDDIVPQLSQALFGHLPEILKPYLNVVLQALVAPLLDAINKVLDARGDATVYLKYTLPKPSPSPSGSPSGSGSCPSQSPGTDQGSLTIKSTTIVPPGQIDLGEHGGENDAGQAPLTVVVGADGSLSGQFTLTSQNHFEAQGISVGTEDTTVVENGSIGGTLCALTLRFLNETTTACTATGVQAELGCAPVGTTIDLTGLVPAEPMGAPTVSGKTLTWSFSNEHSFDAGFGGLTSEVQSTLTITLTAP